MAGLAGFGGERSGALTQWLALPWVPLAAGVFWAVVVVLALRLTAPGVRPTGGTRSGPVRDLPPSPSTVRRPVQASSHLLLLGLVLGGVGGALVPARARCQETTPQAPTETPAAAAEYRVLVPVDEQHPEAVDYVFVPQPFYDLLHRDDQAAPQANWLIRSAEYRAALVWDSTKAAYDVPELVARYGVHVRMAASTLRIPLRESDVLILPEGIRLDGRTVTGTWAEDGASVSLDVPEPGDYQVELKLRPLAGKPGDAARLAGLHSPSCRLTPTAATASANARGTRRPGLRRHPCRPGTPGARQPIGTHANARHHLDEQAGRRGCGHAR